MAESAIRVRFPAGGAFSRDLEVAADAYFANLGRQRRDLPGMYVKSAVILIWFVSSWALLVFFAKGMAQGALCAVSLGLSIAGVGMSVQHDANHGAYSKHQVINRIFGSTLDVMGVCSFIWRPKHNIFHHTYTNIEGVDFDLDFGSLARLSPEQRHRPWHRHQHWYLWFFYGFLLPKWVFFDDFVILHRRLIGKHRLPPPSRAAVAGFFGWKVFFIMWGLVIPSLFHPLWQVLCYHAIAAFTLGATLGTVFQLAHCTDAVEFPALPAAGGKIDKEWAAHQLETCVDFAPKNALVTWFVGGLNFQVEHHLFPKVCHLHYPGLAAVVTAVAERHGLRRRSHGTLTSALGSHFRHLRDMGRVPLTGSSA
jgi:linoleoyl-CoA desaturase